jgi:hypothetical protein
VRTGLFIAAAVIGGLIALLGDDPLWIPAVLALIAFPFAAGAALRARGSAPLPALAVAALAGGLLTVLAVRLAFDAPDWFNAGAVDCGGASDGAQRSILAAAAALFGAAAVAMLVNVLAVGRRAVGAPQERQGGPGALALYPLAVAAAGLALVGASYVTSC